MPQLICVDNKYVYQLGHLHSCIKNVKTPDTLEQRSHGDPTTSKKKMQIAKVRAVRPQQRGGIADRIERRPAARTFEHAQTNAVARSKRAQWSRRMVAKAAQ